MLHFKTALLDRKRPVAILSDILLHLEVLEAGFNPFGADM